MKKFMFLILAMVCVLSMFTIAVAEPTTDIGSGVAAPVTTTTNTTTSATDIALPTNGSMNYGPDAMLDIPNVSTDDLVKKINDKGNDVVTVLQVVGRYVCFFGFIIFCIMIIIGLIGNRQMLTGAIIGAIICGFVYAGITCGKEIVQYIAAWAAN